MRVMSCDASFAMMQMAPSYTGATSVSTLPWLKLGTNAIVPSTKKVVCLYHHVCCSGAPQAITRDPEFISIFGDDLSKMMAVYPHEHDHDHFNGDSH